MRPMRLKIFIHILLITLLTCFPDGLEAKAKTKSRKSTKTTQVAKAKKSTATKSRKKSSAKSSTKKTAKATKKTTTKASKSRRTRTSRHRSRLQALHSSQRYHRATPLSNAEKDSIDSARLRHGGAYTVPFMGLAVERIANLEPMTNRFRHGDTTLTMKNIETLYFTRHGKSDDKSFFGDILPKVDDAVKHSKYKEAYALTQKGLWRNPMHVGLIKRACELSEHQGDTLRSDVYVWQIAELFNLIQNTGDGKTVKTAMRVVNKEDALLYEQLWLETPKEDILGEKLTPYEGCDLLTLSVRDKKGKVSQKYYIVGQ